MVLTNDRLVYLITFVHHLFAYRGLRMSKFLIFSIISLSLSKNWNFAHYKIGWIYVRYLYRNYSLFKSFFRDLIWGRALSYSWLLSKKGWVIRISLMRRFIFLRFAVEKGAVFTMFARSIYFIVSTLVRMPSLTPFVCAGIEPTVFLLVCL
jgi:hypothetical protein